MPNWWKELNNKQEARYRAVFPIDVTVTDSGNEDRNKNVVYETITNTLNGTPLTNFWLEMGDIERRNGRL